MRIIACIKQVPGTSNVKVDPVTGVLIRDGVESKMNPYDLFALETAIRLKEEYGGSVTAISMGPPAAKAVLREAIYMGSDDGILISDRRFGGADVLATSMTIASAIKAMGDIDLIICGKQTTDGDTAQVGAEMSEHLGLPYYANVNTITREDRVISCSLTLGEMVMDADIELPAVISTDGEINTPRLPSYRRKKALGDCEDLIRVLSLDDFEDKNEKHYGLSGSPTQVERIFPPEKNDMHEVFEGDSVMLAGKIFELLKSKKFV